MLMLGLIWSDVADARSVAGRQSGSTVFDWPIVFVKSFDGRRNAAVPRPFRIKYFTNPAY